VVASPGSARPRPGSRQRRPRTSSQSGSKPLSPGGSEIQALTSPAPARCSTRRRSRSPPRRRAPSPGGRGGGVHRPAAVPRRLCPHAPREALGNVRITLRAVSPGRRATPAAATTSAPPLLHRRLLLRQPLRRELHRRLPGLQPGRRRRPRWDLRRCGRHDPLPPRSRRLRRARALRWRERRLPRGRARRRRAPAAATAISATRTDRCQAGRCTGTSPVTCAAARRLPRRGRLRPGPPGAAPRRRRPTGGLRRPGSLHPHRRLPRGSCRGGNPLPASRATAVTPPASAARHQRALLRPDQGQRQQLQRRQQLHPDRHLQGGVCQGRDP